MREREILKTGHLIRLISGNLKSENLRKTDYLPYFFQNDYRTHHKDYEKDLKRIYLIFI